MPRNQGYTSIPSLVIYRDNRRKAQSQLSNGPSEPKGLAG